MNGIDAMSNLAMDDLWGIDLSLQEDRSGQDLDVLGGQVLTPVLIPAPHGPELCPRKEHGRCTCPAGQELCLAFAEELRTLTREPEEEDPVVLDDDGEYEGT